MRTTNPTLREEYFTRTIVYGEDRMTTEGTATKTALLVVIALLTASYTWSKFFQWHSINSINGLMTFGAFAGFIVSIITLMKKEWSPITAPLYAACEGLFLGGISAIVEASYPGIGIQTVALTLGTLGALVLAYKSGLIKVTERFTMILVAGTGAIAFLYMISMLLGIFGLHVPYIFGNGVVGIAFSIFVVAIAALNLVLDFEFISKGQAYGAPKYMEWYGAFGLMVSLVWLYVETLRLLSKLRENDRN
ncbi:MAG: hypothetical protein K0S74_264 [Chlamydiales bacterium]|jgi:uncharacterized YccA/Bax inhibitor family protein|nr:hypothetical protein [Chlamydiales bacterium]